MKLKILLFVLAFLQYSLIQAQPELGDNDVEGVIITNNDVKEGILRLNGSANYPWARQSKVFFISSEKAEGLSKLKKKDFEKYNPKDLEGYQFGANRYLTAKYTAMSDLGMNIGAKKFFLYNLVEGEISLYIYYESPPAVVVGEDLDAIYEELRNNPSVLIEKGNKPSKDINMVNILNYIEDCPVVKEKYLAEGYGIKPVNTDEKKGLKKLVGNLVNSENVKKAMIEIFTEYNEKCGG